MTIVLYNLLKQQGNKECYIMVVLIYTMSCAVCIIWMTKLMQLASNILILQRTSALYYTKTKSGKCMLLVDHMAFKMFFYSCQMKQRVAQNIQQPCSCRIAFAYLFKSRFHPKEFKISCSYWIVKFKNRFHDCI